jgi:recombination protein RecA
MLVYRARYGEKAFNRAIRFAEEGIPLIVIDSVPSMQPKDDIDKIRKAVNSDTETEMRIGGVARLMDKYLPTLEDVIEQTGTTVIFINQIRDKMNALPFGDNIQTPGGHKLKHSCSLRIQVARKGWIEIPNKNPWNTAAKEKIGLIMKCKVVKSKVCDPMGECEIPMFFERGFVGFENLEAVRKEILKEHTERYKNL